MKRWDYLIVAGALLLFTACVLRLQFGASAGFHVTDDGVSEGIGGISDGVGGAGIGEADRTRIAEVRVAGELYDTISLEKNSVTDIEVPQGKLTVASEGGEVYVVCADCPSQDCVRTGRIGNSGEIIVCLPNRVLISVVTGNGTAVAPETEVDAIAG